jgi:hypothetical protein
MKELKKLKEQYRVSLTRKTTFFCGMIENSYVFRRDGYCRNFSTKQEKALSALHEIEYKKYGLKIRCKRNLNLVDAWEDLPSFVYRGDRDWKRNSKRKHQYFRIREV